MRRLFASWLALAMVALLVSGTTVQAQDEPKEKTTEEKIADAESVGKDAAKRGDTAWMLVSTALVMFMMPGLALFYGGMVRRKNMLATMMQTMVALAVVGVYWIAIGYSLAFGPSILGSASEGTGIIGFSPHLIFLQGIKVDDYLPGYNIPVYLHVMFQGMFAIITPALISGAFAERVKFLPYCLFLILWVTFVYCPLAHMVWAWNWFLPEGGLGAGDAAIGLLGNKLGALDFAGGTVVHIAAGFAGLAATLVLKKRTGYPHVTMHPGSMVLTLTGAAMLWFGWFGFNGGSAVMSNALAVSAFAATQAAAAAAALTWVITEWLIKGKPTALGLASGMVAGLVAVTPAAGFVFMWGGLVIGAIAGVVCYLAVLAKGLLGYDDSLDAFGVHGVGGFIGAVLTGLLCSFAVNPIASLEENSFLLNGNLDQFIIQLKAAVGSAIFAFVISAVLIKFIDIIFGFTTTADEEVAGLDLVEHGEAAFDFGLGQEGTPNTMTGEPRSAAVPPNGMKRFTLVVDGGEPATMMKTWAEVCQPGVTGDADFSTVYSNLTTVSGNKFRFRTGDPKATAKALETLLQKRLGRTPITVRVEA